MKQNKIVCACIEYQGWYLPSVRHWDRFNHDIAKFFQKEVPHMEFKHGNQGFLDSKGQFHDRKKAMAIAYEAGQLNVDTEVEYVNGKHKDLYSEDLY